MAALMLLFLVVLLALVVALYALIGVFVYKDAKRRGMNALLWTVVAILVPGLIGVVIYLLARNSMAEGMLCAKCSSPVQESFLVCPKCGNELASPCPGCGKENPKDWHMCPYCKAELPEPSQALKPARRTSKGLVAAIIAVIALTFALLITGLVVFPMLAFSTNTTPSLREVGSIESNMPTSFSDRFLQSNGTKEKGIYLQKGQTLKLKTDIVVERGKMTAEITDPAGKQIRMIDLNHFADVIEIKAEETGDYTIKLTFEDCGGHYSFSWTIE